MTSLPNIPANTQPDKLTPRALWCRWMLATTLGELVGFLAPAVVGVIVAQALTTLDSARAALVLLVSLTIAGFGEGAALGYAQWRVLRRVLPGIGWKQWTGATALAAVVAWLLGMLPNTLVDSVGLPTIVLVAVWLLVAPVLLLTIGVGQWLVLRRHVLRASRWIMANAIGWTLGVAITFMGASAISETMPLVLAVGIGVASGSAMGLVVGCITGVVLVQLVGNQAVGSNVSWYPPTKPTP